jgi:flagellar motor switch protein FliM
MPEDEALTQEEIDSILKSMSSGEPAEKVLEEFEEENKRVKEYDFRRPMKFSREQLRTLQLIHESFAREISTYLSGRCRTFVDVKYASIDQITFSEFQKSLNSPTYIAIFSSEAFAGSGILQMGLDLGYTIIDRLLGGSGTPLEESRVPTEIEMNILKKESAVMLRMLARSWSNIEEFDINLENLETNPQFVQVAPSNEMTILITLSITIRNVQGFINLCFPSSTLEPLNDKLTTRMWTTTYRHTEEFRENLKQTLMLSKLNLSAILGKAVISLSDFFNLEIGDVIRLDSFYDEPIDLEIENHPIFKIKIGKSKGFYAGEIIQKNKELLEKLLVEESMREYSKRNKDHLNKEKETTVGDEKNA